MASAATGSDQDRRSGCPHDRPAGSRRRIVTDRCRPGIWPVLNVRPDDVQPATGSNYGKVVVRNPTTSGVLLTGHASCGTPCLSPTSGRKAAMCAGLAMASRRRTAFDEGVAIKKFGAAQATFGHHVAGGPGRRESGTSNAPRHHQRVLATAVGRPQRELGGPLTTSRRRATVVFASLLSRLRLFTFGSHLRRRPPEVKSLVIS